MRTILTHPKTGLPIVPLGRRRDGRLIWPILGGAEDDDTDDTDADEGSSGADGDTDTDSVGDDTEDAEDAEDAGADDLGDAGKQALDRMKAKLKEERAKRRRAEQKLAESDEDGEERQRDREALDRANKRIVKSEVKAAAAGKLADPMDAHRFLDLDSFEVDDDGNVDEDEIADAIDELIKEKPYLAAQGGRRFKGDASGGVRKGPKKPSIESQIAEAEKARDFPRVIRLKQQAAAERAAASK